MLAVCGCCPSLQAQGQVKQAFEDFRTETWKVETVVEPAVTAAGSQFIFKPAGFGKGAEGYGYHYGVSLADNVNGKFIRKFVFPSLSGHLDQYRPKGKGTVLRRLLNAAGHTIFVDPQGPKKSFNWSGLPASFTSAGLSNAYQPSEQRTLSATLQRIGTNSGGYLFGDVLSEFQPELRAAGCAIPVVRAILKCK